MERYQTPNSVTVLTEGIVYLVVRAGVDCSWRAAAGQRSAFVARAAQRVPRLQLLPLSAIMRVAP